MPVLQVRIEGTLEICSDIEAISLSTSGRTIFSAPGHRKPLNLERCAHPFETAALWPQVVRLTPDLPGPVRRALFGWGKPGPRRRAALKELLGSLRNGGGIEAKAIRGVHAPSLISPCASHLVLRALREEEGPAAASASSPPAPSSSGMAEEHRLLKKRICSMTRTLPSQLETSNCRSCGGAAFALPMERLADLCLSLVEPARAPAMFKHGLEAMRSTLAEYPELVLPAPPHPSCAVHQLSGGSSIVMSGGNGTLLFLDFRRRIAGALKSWDGREASAWAALVLLAPRLGLPSMPAGMLEREGTEFILLERKHHPDVRMLEGFEAA